MDAPLMDVGMRPFHDFLLKISLHLPRQVLNGSARSSNATMLTIRIGWTHRRLLSQPGKVLCVVSYLGKGWPGRLRCAMCCVWNSSQFVLNMQTVHT